MFITVIHTAFEDQPETVARVEALGDTVQECLEYAYRWTQNIEGSWSIKDGNPDNNPGVTVLKDLHVAEDGKKWGHRSTSVRDRMRVEGANDLWEVASIGFKMVDKAA